VAILVSKYQYCPNGFSRNFSSAVSLKKIDLRQGALLAYIAQPMLQTSKASDTKTAARKSLVIVASPRK
jgi:hypothetical protein